jgi:4-aminobutyrate aminotransferase-like enzyme
MSERYEIIGDARGRGLMLGVELVEDRKTKAPAIRRAEEILLGAFKRGVALRRSESTIMMTPPLTITREYVDSGLSVLEGVLKGHSGAI